jgi:hypothetical protein
MRRELVVVTFAVALLVAAFVIPHLHLGIVTPLVNASPLWQKIFANTAPILAAWNPHVGWGTIPAIVIGVGAVVWGPTLARRLPWRALPWATWSVSCAWAFSLAMIDGWHRGYAARMTSRDEYLWQVPNITDIPVAVRTFTTRILDFQPNSWTTHVSGHPPGAILSFVWLDRIGLGGGAWAATFCLLVGSSAAAAIVVTVRSLLDEDTARQVAPFVAVAPTAIWIAVSADGYYAGVAAWGLTLLALAVRGTTRIRMVPAAGAGLLLGWGIFLNYGLALVALPAVAILLCAKDLRAAVRVLIPAIVAAVVVAVAFLAAGFWWFDGYTLVQQRYWQGIAKDRPFQYWSWANFASVVCAIGLGSVAGLARAFDIAAIKRRSGLHLIVLASLLAIVLADLSMLSKAETERIWLPFTIWLAAAAALLPIRSHRWWLALNVIGALLLNHVLLTNW